MEDLAQVRRRDGTELRDRYSLMYQITRLTRERDCIPHDDRVEGLAGLMMMLIEFLGLSPEDQAKKRRQQSIEEEIAKFDKEFDDLQGRVQLRSVLRGKLRSGGNR